MRSHFAFKVWRNTDFLLLALWYLFFAVRSTFLNKFETLARLYHQLTEELDRAVTESGFENYLLQPKAVADDPELVPNLLRTKLEPDVESDLDKLNKSYIDDVDGTDQSAESLESRISSFNSFVLAAVERYEDAREDLLVNPRPVESPPQMPSANAQALLTALSSGAPIP